MSEANELRDGGWSLTEKGWVLDPSQTERVRALQAEEMARIDRAQAHYPQCALCGQRATSLDRFGLCSKVSDPHKEWRAGVRADEKAGVR